MRCRCVAALAKEGEIWRIIVDGKVWQNRLSMAWRPVFSPNAEHLAAKVEIDGKYTIALDDRLWSHTCEAVWDPVFSPAGDHILIRSIEDGTYYRRVVPISDLT